MSNAPRLLRITTVPISLYVLLRGQFAFFHHHGFEVLTVSAGGREVDYLKKERVKHQVVPMTRAITPFRDLMSLVYLIHVIRKFKPDIIHTHTPKAGLLGMMAGWMCRIPVRMHTVAGLPLMEATGVKHFLLMWTERITYGCATHVYPNSKGLLEYIQSKIKNQKSKIKIIGKGSSNGIDTVYFLRNEALEQQAKEIRNQYGISENTIVFSFVGRIVKDKGIVELILAFQKIVDVLPARLLLIGSFEKDLDPLPDEINTYIEGNPQVILAGFQHDVRPWIMASDVFVFPSYREGFPNAVMQAACLEIPCIVSDINGCNEIIEHDETGIVVPAKDADNLYTAMHVLAHDKTKRISFGQKSREYVVKNFDQHYVWGELLKEYKNLLVKSSDR